MLEMYQRLLFMIEIRQELLANERLAACLLQFYGLFYFFHILHIT